jgi:hypothetical protein
MGKKKYIETPDKMWELFQEYKNSLTPREIQKATPKGVLTEYHTPPLTMAGFECFVMDWEGIESKGVEQYFSNRDNRYSEYVGICSRIKKLIRKDQIEGGMVGQYNSSITQRLNGLTEKTDVTTNGQSISKINVNIVKKGLFEDDED